MSAESNNNFHAVNIYVSSLIHPVLDVNHSVCSVCILCAVSGVFLDIT